MEKICANCKGKGSYWKTSIVDKFFSELRHCSTCKGTGIVYTDKK
jgi:DnaJ-class molecular chaperone